MPMSLEAVVAKLQAILKEEGNMHVYYGSEGRWFDFEEAEHIHVTKETDQGISMKVLVLGED